MLQSCISFALLCFVPDVNLKPQIHGRVLCSTPMTESRMNTNNKKRVREGLVESQVALAGKRRNYVQKLFIEGVQEGPGE